MLLTNKYGYKVTYVVTKLKTQVTECPLSLGQASNNTRKSFVNEIGKHYGGIPITA